MRRALKALIYMKGSDGDPNKVLIAYSLIYMLPLSAKIPFNWRDLTPVSVVAMDQFVLWTNAQAPYRPAWKSAALRRERRQPAVQPTNASSAVGITPMAVNAARKRVCRAAAIGQSAEPGRHDGQHEAGHAVRDGRARSCWWSHPDPASGTV